MDPRRLQHEIPYRESFEPSELDLEVSDLIAIDAAFDDGFVPLSAGGIELEPMQLTFDAGKGRANFCITPIAARSTPANYAKA